MNGIVNGASGHSKASIRHQFFDSSQGLEVDFNLPESGTLGIFGVSGSGKTSLLKVLSGLLRADSARIQFGNQCWQSEEEFIPAHLREIGYVFQEPTLFPHLSVADNLAYAANRTAKRATKRSASATLDLDSVIQTLEIDRLLTRTTQYLSGGEQQRVAIARALAVSPKLLLMDEPLSALDDALKREVLPFLSRLQEEFRIPMIYVSHSTDELAVLADDLLILDKGKIVVSGPIEKTFPHLGLDSDAQLAVLVEGVIGHKDSEWQLATVDFPGGNLTIRDPGLALGAPARLRVQARDISLGLNQDDSSSILNRLSATITAISVGDDTAMRLVTANVSDGAANKDFMAQITSKSAHDLDLQVGQQVYLQIKSVAILN